MFRTRLISGIIIAISIAVFTYIGGIWLLALLLLASLRGMFELYRATGVLEEGKRINLITGIAYVFCALYYAVLYAEGGNVFWVVFTTVLFLLILLAAYVFTFPKYDAKQIAFTFLGFFYVGVMISFYYLTRSESDGIFIVWLILAGSWLCDVCAYATGMTLGRHKLAPVLSPKKSVEGSVGGIVIPAVIAFVYGYVISRFYSPSYPVAPMFAILTAVGAAASQIGDLSASAIKRNVGIKDYGELIPGHGGVLDRFDSLIFTAPMIYFVAVMLIKR
ncbi:MAG: phosphatidate cytidylyltransferase [Lachnospiraceae bacterium]|nr:phosphatidate cytidylyltransferase [Lachnospiraceae bacterium]MBR2529841.1 phosphatidate cytidylyltransferase [Lachnospiraceae bacterium]